MSSKPSAFNIKCQDGDLVEVQEEDAQTIVSECQYFRAAFESSGMKETEARIIHKSNWTRATVEKVVKLLSTGGLSGLGTRDLVNLAPALDDLCVNVSTAGGLLDSMKLADLDAYLSKMPWHDIHGDLNNETARQQQWRSFKVNLIGRHAKLVSNGGWEGLMEDGIVAVPTDAYHIRWNDKDRSQEPRTAYGGLRRPSDAWWDIVSIPYNGATKHSMSCFYQPSTVPLVQVIQKVASLIRGQEYVEYETCSTPIASMSLSKYFLASKDHPEFTKRTGLDFHEGCTLDISGMSSLAQLSSVLRTICELNKWGDNVEAFLKSIKGQAIGVRLMRPSNELLLEFLAHESCPTQIIYEPNHQSIDLLMNFVSLASTTATQAASKVKNFSLVIEPNHMFRGN